MSLVNQVLRDLEDRRGAAPDADGLRAAAARPATGRLGWWLGLAGVAAVTGAGLFALERALQAPDAARPLPAAVAEPVAVTAGAEVIAEPAMESVAETVSDPGAEVAVEPSAEPRIDDEPPVQQLQARTDAPQPETPEPESVQPDADAAPVEAPAPQARPLVSAEGSLQRTLVTESPQQRAGDAFGAGVRALSEGRRGAAESAFRAALGHDASHHDARLALANLLAGDGRLREAEAQLQEGLRLAPQRWPLADRYARMLFERGDLAGAIGVLTHAPPPVDSAPDYHALLAALLQRAGNHDAAAATYQALVATRADHGLWWMGLAISLESVGRTDAALDAYSRAVRDARLSADVVRFVRERIAVLDDGGGR